MRGKILFLIVLSFLVAFAAFGQDAIMVDSTGKMIAPKALPFSKVNRADFLEGFWDGKPTFYLEVPAQALNTANALYRVPSLRLVEFELLGIEYDGWETPKVVYRFSSQNPRKLNGNTSDMILTGIGDQMFFGVIPEIRVYHSGNTVPPVCGYQFRPWMAMMLPRVPWNAPQNGWSYERPLSQNLQSNVLVAVQVRVMDNVSSKLTWVYTWKDVLGNSVTHTTGGMSFWWQVEPIYSTRK